MVIVHEPGNYRGIRIRCKDDQAELFVQVKRVRVENAVSEQIGRLSDDDLLLDQHIVAEIADTRTAEAGGALHGYGVQPWHECTEAGAIGDCFEYVVDRRIQPRMLNHAQRCRCQATRIVLVLIVRNDHRMFVLIYLIPP